MPMSFCHYYDFEIETIVKFIREIKAKKILLQLPEGLQICASEIIQLLRNAFGDLEVILSQNPSFGSCLVDEYGAIESGADAIIHIGHIEYKYYKPKTPTLFIRGAYRGIDKDKITMLLSQVCKEQQNKVTICIGTTAQHMAEIDSFVKELRNCRIVYKGIILGCIPINPSNCDNTIIIAGGKFHCVTQALYNLSLGKHISTLCIDPYTNDLWNPEKDVEKILHVRLWKVREAFEARKWLIINGFYGQHRPYLINALIERLRSLGKEYVVVKALGITRDLLDNIGAESFDVIVITACPHVAFELDDYIKPVITAGEAMMALRRDLSRYIYPW
jgi:2-(3-amino-3-carboxypropyl)histidine synthase